MSEIITLFQTKYFTLESANALLPSIINITNKTNSKVKLLLAQLEAFKNKDIDKAKNMEHLIDLEVSIWQRKIKALGGEGKGIYMVDFDTGGELLCWKYPETTIEHKHSYTEGFQARIKIL